MSSSTSDAIDILIREPGGERGLRLPFRIGGAVGDDVMVPGVAGGETLLLHFADGEFQVTSAGEGALLNGMPLPGGRTAILCSGDVLALGEARLLFGVVATEDGAHRPVLEVRHLVANDTIAPPADDSESMAMHGVADERVVASKLADVGIPSGAMPAAATRTSTLGLSRRTMAIAAVLTLLFVGFVWQLSRLETVSIKVQPAAAEVSGSGFGWRSANTLLLLPGERRVRAELEGYVPVERVIEVREDASLSIDLQLLPKPGILDIDTGGVGARVFVDGAEAGRAPGPVEVQGGTRTLAIRADRHLDHVATVEVEGRGVRQPIVVKLQPSWGSLQVSATTPGATLSVDDAAPLALPAKVDLPAGLHRLRISAAGSKDWQSAVLLKAGEQQSIGPIELGAPDARLRVTSTPSGADVTVGGVFRGRTPATVALAAGSDHDVAVALQGYRVVERRVFATADKDLALPVALQPIPVSLTVQGEPADAEVVIAGTVKGKTPFTFDLPARRHTLEIRKDGMQTERIDVDLSAAVDRSIDYKLVPVGRSRDWKPPPAAMRAQSGTMLRLIPGGEFTMGSERREQGRRANEFPRKVTLARPFYFGTREVTNGEFRRFKADHASGFIGKRTLDLDPQPVSNVSWNDAVEYCNWLSTQEGLPPAYQKKDGRWVLIQPVTTGYRLPTEAEWEFVARHPGAGTRSQRYEWGDALPPPPGIGNLAGAEAAQELPRVLEGWQDDYQVVAPPGKFRANGFGIFDMTGNVSEWVHDAFVSFETNAGGTDPIGPPAGGARHVIKGSNWRTVTFADLRAAWREGADGTSQDIGFRVARYAE